MKLSKYTFLFDTENKEYYAYNSLSNALIEIDADSYLFLQKYQQYKGGFYQFHFLFLA